MLPYEYCPKACETRFLIRAQGGQAIELFDICEALSDYEAKDWESSLFFDRHGSIFWIVKSDEHTLEVVLQGKL